MKAIILFAFLAFMTGAKAQVKKVYIQASGLTCSMCSNSINKSLKSIGYIEKVTSNIKTSSFEISFKPNAAVNFDQLKKKVEDAGFFVSKFTAVISMNRQSIENDAHVIVENRVFHFLNVKSQELSGDVTLQLLDKGYVPPREFKKNAVYTKMACYKIGVAGSCCTDMQGVSPASRVFHVTLV